MTRLLLCLFILCTLVRWVESLSPLVAYTTTLQKWPLATNIVTASMITVCSDSISQAIERFNNRGKAVCVHHSWKRSLNMAVYGSAVSGAFIFNWFKFLDKLVPVPLTFPRVCYKIFVNQFFMAPFLSSLFFAWVIFTRETSSFQEKQRSLRKKLKSDLLPTIQKACVYWSILHLFNFSIVPKEFQVVYTSFGFLIWTTYLSIVGYRKVD